MPIYYKNRKTGKIEGKFKGCDTQSSLFRNPKLYKRIVTDEDLPLDIQPTPTPLDAPTELTLKSPNGTIWKLTIDNLGNIHPQKEIIKTP